MPDLYEYTRADVEEAVRIKKLRNAQIQSLLKQFLANGGEIKTESERESQCIDCKEMLHGGDDAKLTQHKRKSGLGRTLKIKNGGNLI